MLTSELDLAVKELIQSIVQLQDRAFARDPLRARARKRYVTGLRETEKYLRLKRIKLIIVAPDLEVSSPDGVLLKTVNGFKDEAEQISIPCVFALDRKRIGFCSLRKIPVSVFGILNYEGLEDRVKAVIQHHEASKNLFLKYFTSNSTSNCLVDTSEITSTLIEKLTIAPNKSSSDQSVNPFLKALESFE